VVKKGPSDRPPDSSGAEGLGGRDRREEDEPPCAEENANENANEDSPRDAGGDFEDRIASAIADFVDRRAAGDGLNLQAFLAEYPDLSPMLAEALGAVEEIDPLIKDTTPPKQFGDYRIVREIGRGGMGIVYEAVQISLDRRVALKVLPASFLAEPKAVARFLRESKVAARLHHENIVRIFQRGIEAGVPYFVMELVEGRTLRDYQLGQGQLGQGQGAWNGRGSRRSSQETQTESLHRKETAASGGETVRPGGGLRDTDPRDLGIDRSDFKRMGEAFAEVADGLHHAHTLGVIHRDVKPSNLILDRKGRLRILDFGLARLEGQEPLTLSGEYVGTPRYMSPEQAQFQRHAVGPGTDIYSLGVTIYEAIAGTPPFRGRNRDHTLSLIIHKEPPPLRKLNPKTPRDLETIVLKCLRKAPQERYVTAEALAQDLRRWLRRMPIEARPYSPGEKIVRYVLRNKAKMAALAGFLILLASLGWLGMSHRREVLARRIEDYDFKVRGAVMKMQQGLLTRKVKARDAVKGDYLEWFFLPTTFVDVGREDLLWLKRQARANNPVEETVTQLKEAERMFPAKPDAYYHSAWALMMLGRDQEALEELMEAPESVASFVPAMVLRAILLERRGESDRARAAMEGATQRASGGWEKAWLLAERGTLQEDWKEAAQAYHQLMEIDAGGEEPFVGASIETYIGGGVAFLELNDFAQAIEAFAMAQGRSPKSAEPVLLLGKTYLLKGEKSSAEEKFQELLSRAPLKDEAALGVAEIYGSLEENDEALSWVAKIEDERLRERSRAVFLVKTGRWAEACTALEQVLKLDPADALASSWLGLAQMQGLEKIPEAIRSLREGTRLDPKNPIAHVWLGDALARQGLLDAALAEYDVSISLDASNPWAHVSMGVTWSRQGQLGKAFEGFVRAVEANPRLATIYNNFNDLIQRDLPPLGELRKRFLAALRREVKHGEDPLRPEMCRALALVLLLTPESNDLQKALRYAAQAVESTERLNPRMLATLAKAQFANGQKEEAVLTLEEALRLTQATQAMESELKKYRQDILPDLASYASVDGVLAAIDVETFILEGDLWRYFRGRKEPPGDWKAIDFDDASWELGESGFGYGDGDDNTLLDDMKEAYGTVYVRHELNIPDPGRHGQVLVSVKADDGFVAYVNGKEIRRFNAAPERSPIPFDGHALKEATEPLTPTEFRVPASWLMPGKNVLALQGLNSSLKSSDFSLIPVMARERPPDPERDQRLLERFRAFVRKGSSEEAARRRLEYLEGRALQRSDKHDEAAETFRRLAEKDPRRPEPLLRFVECLKSLGRFEEAAKLLIEALGAFPQDKDLWNFWMALSFLDLKRTPAQMLAAFPLEDEAELGQGAADSQAAYGMDLEWLLKRLRNGNVVRINCGGGDYLDEKGQAWGKDRFFHSGYRFGEPLWGIFVGKHDRLFTGDIEGTGDDFIYQSERWFPVDHLPPAGYQVPLPSGSYRVTLHFVEVFHRQGGRRWFDVRIEDLPVREGYEPFERGFKTADHLSFPVTVSDGFLDIELVRQLDSPTISGIEIQPVR
jgi:serine/threonine protein kinase/Flp pilus assembly protein TadD